MSLNNPKPAKTWRYGIIPSRSFENGDLLPELFEGRIDLIGHLYTNGASATVERFARDSGIPYTTFPITGGKSLPWAISRIVENSDAVYVIADQHSKSAAQAIEACEKRAKKDAEFRFKLVPFEPVDHLRTKLGKIAEIVACAAPEDEAKNPIISSIKEAL